MVDMNVKTPTKKATSTEDPRAGRRDERKRRLKVISEGKAPTVKVYASDDSIRRSLRHSSGARFRDTLDQAVEWPNDSFTARRIRDGSVRTDGPSQHHPEALLDESLNPRQHAVARAGAREIVDHIKDPPKTALPASKSDKQSEPRASA